MDVIREAQKAARAYQKGKGSIWTTIKNLPRLAYTALGAAVGAGVCYFIFL